MSAIVFARTKIQPPRHRPGLLARQRVADPLAAALAQQRLVLVCAPAGFGKTVALTQQIATLPASTALAWVGADERDDLGRLANCLIAALDPYDRRVIGNRPSGVHFIALRLASSAMRAGHCSAGNCSSLPFPVGMKGSRSSASAPTALKPPSVPAFNAGATCYSKNTGTAPAWARNDPGVRWGAGGPGEAVFDPGRAPSAFGQAVPAKCACTNSHGG